MNQELQEAPRTESEEPVMQELDREECLRLLATQSVGRVAVSNPGWAPHVVPVNYLLLRDSIVFRSGPGTKLRHLLTEPISFEVDFVDSFHRAGWSVLVQGLAYQLSSWEIDAEDLHVEPFASGKKDYWVRLVAQSITGRRIALPEAAPFDPRGYL